MSPQAGPGVPPPVCVRVCPRAPMHGTLPILLPWNPLRHVAATVLCLSDLLECNVAGGRNRVCLISAFPGLGPGQAQRILVNLSGINRNSSRECSLAPTLSVVTTLHASLFSPFLALSSRLLDKPQCSQPPPYRAESWYPCASGSVRLSQAINVGLSSEPLI